MPHLPHDIVFQLMHSDLGSNPLDTLRRLSQISQSWRAIALSPTLWAKAPDFEDLRPKKDIWRAEVVRRTENSTLHVNGSWIPSVTQEFFLHKFLVPNMHRIKTLHAHVGLMTNKIARDPAWSVIFDQPAPVLEVFSLDFDVRHTQDPPRAIQRAFKDGKPLFANHAPTLHTLNNNPYLILYSGMELTSDWMVNLTTIMLSENPKTVLAILARTPRLTRLFLLRQRFAESAGFPDVSSVKLPYLEFIYKDVNYSDESFFVIQQAIEAPPGLSIFATFEIASCIPKAASIFREYVEKTRPTKLLLRFPSFWLCDFSLDARAVDVHDMFRDESRKDFAIRIGYEWDEWVDPGDLLELIMEEGVDFGSLREWCIQRREISCTSDHIIRTITALKNFFAKILLPNQTLSVDRWNYKSYFGRREVFPEGHTVEVVDNGPHDSDDGD